LLLLDRGRCAGDAVVAAAAAVAISARRSLVGFLSRRRGVRGDGGVEYGVSGELDGAVEERLLLRLAELGEGRTKAESRNLPLLEEEEKRWERFSLLGLFAARAVDAVDAASESDAAAAAPSTSSRALAFDGRPFAMAEEDVCWEMDKGIFDLSYHDLSVELDCRRRKLEASDM
jgi:hypothetical protein